MGIAAYADCQNGPRIYIFAPDPSVPTQLHYAQRAADVQQREGFSQSWSVSLALLARKTPRFTTTHVLSRSEGKEGGLWDVLKSLQFVEGKQLGIGINSRLLNPIH